MSAGIEPASGIPVGADSPLPTMLQLRIAVETVFDLQAVRKGFASRGVSAETVAVLRHEEEVYTRKAAKLLRQTAIGAWLVEQKTAGLHAARIVSLMNDPRRFPGQKCTEGHTRVPDFEVGSRCAIKSDDDEQCPGLMLEPRTTTGVRSLWHWGGLHVVDGRLPMRRKGVQADWTTKVRTSCLMPDAGVAAQMVRNRANPYRAVYDAAKERLASTRTDLRPFQVESRARTIAVKAWLGDMLVEWKKIEGSAV